MKSVQVPEGRQEGYSELQVLQSAAGYYVGTQAQPVRAAGQRRRSADMRDVYERISYGAAEE